MKYQRPGTKSENLLTFGDYPQISLAAARDRRAEAKRLLADNIDPALQREIDRQTAAAAAANTFETIANEWLAIKRKGWSASHDKRVTAILNKDIFPQIVARQEGVSASLLFTWRKLDREGALVAVGAGEAVVPASELAAARAEIAKLQRVLGKKTLENEILKEAVEIAAAKKWIARSPLLPGDDQ